MEGLASEVVLEGRREEVLGEIAIGTIEGRNDAEKRTSRIGHVWIIENPAYGR